MDENKVNFGFWVQLMCEEEELESELRRIITFPEVKSELQGRTSVDRDPQISALRMKLTGAEKTK